MTFTRLRLLLCVLLLALPLAASAQYETPEDRAALVKAWELSKGEERILSFVSDVKVAESGDLDVTETIRIVSLAQEIKHGIQRDFPTTYKSKYGQRTRVGFQVVSVEADGEKAKWEQMGITGGERIRIGEAEKMLPVGLHTYVIRYKTTRQIFYGEKSDELYWNVTGNGWTFPIDMAEGRITLPKAVSFGDRSFYTGPDGSTARNASVVSEQPGHIVFRTTAPLGKAEGLTVAAAFPKGVLVAPDFRRRLGWWLDDWGALAAALVTMLALIGYYIRAWVKAGRNPRPGTIVPIFSPPNDLTPAATRYISRMGFDNRAFTAAIVDLGVRRQIHVSQEEGGWFQRDTTTLRRTEGPDQDGLPAPEMAMRRGLFSLGGTIALKQENHTTLQSARSALEKGLDSAYLDKTYSKNRDWALLGLLLIPAAMILTALFATLTSSVLPTSQKIGFPIMAAVLAGAAWWLGQVAMKMKGCMSVLVWVGVVALGFVASGFAFGLIAAALYVGAVAIFLPLILLPLAISAFFWMYAPTKEGRLLMDRIAGFKQYLSITEEHRLDALHPPEKTPELFERYLPYAIALDVENRWADKFAGVLAAAAAAGAATHTASWYSGRDNFWDNPQGFASTVGSSLNSTVSSAATSPSSSGGGSSGGGSSGGGGGGGGGSGW